METGAGIRGRLIIEHTEAPRLVDCQGAEWSTCLHSFASKFVSDHLRTTTGKRA